MIVSPSLHLVLQLAAQEALAARFREIEPEHLLMGLCKLAELPVDELAGLQGQADGMGAVLEGLGAVRAALEQRQLDSTLVRRQLRRKLGQGEAERREPNDLRRSPATRRLCETAAERARSSGDPAIGAVHLLMAILANPTPLIGEVVRPAAASTGKRSGVKLLLDRHGRDLTELARQGELPATDRLEPGRAMLRILSAPRPRNLVLLADDPETHDRAVAGLAQLLNRSEIPDGLQGKRLIELNEPLSGLHPPAGTVSLLQDLLAEAAESAATIVVVRLFDEALWSHGMRDVVRAAALDVPQRVILQTSQDFYTTQLKDDREWKRRIWGMQVDRSRPERIPLKL